MRTRILTFILSLLFIQIAAAQVEVLMTNSQKVDEKRYDKYNGSAYLWESPKKVKVYPINAEKIDFLSGNFNMYEGEFEIYDKEKFVTLPHRQYPKIEFFVDDELQLTFIASPKGIQGNYAIQHYADESIYILEERRRLLSTVTVQTPGQTQKIEKFKKSSDFFILKDGQLIGFEPSKKKLSKKFGHKKEIGKFVKSNKLKLKNPADLVQLIRYIDEQGWIK